METPTKKPINWRLVPEETSTAGVTFVLTEDDSAMGPLKAHTKWDGCTHLWLPYDERFDHWHEKGVHYEHICDMDEFIGYLQAVREKARAYFGGEFGVAPLNEWQYRDNVAKIQGQEQAS